MVPFTDSGESLNEQRANKEKLLKRRCGKMACRCACMGVAINKSRTLKKLSASPVWWFMGKDVNLQM